MEEFSTISWPAPTGSKEKLQRPSLKEGRQESWRIRRSDCATKRSLLPTRNQGVELRESRPHSSWRATRKENPGAISVALQSGTLEDTTKVLQWLEQSLHLREGNLLLMSKSAPEFDFLRTDPRFQDVLRRIGVPQ
jgi:hypothetical protein